MDVRTITTEKVTDLAVALDERLDELSRQAVAALAERLPDYLTQLGFEREDPSQVARATLEEMILVLRTIGAAIPAQVRRSAFDVGRRRAEQGFTLEHLLEADSIHRETVVRELEKRVRSASDADEVLLLAERRLDSHHEQIVLAMTKGYLEGHSFVYEREHRELAALMSIMRAVSRSLDSREVSAAALAETIRAMRLDSGSIWLVPKAQPDELSLLASHGLSADEEATIGPVMPVRGLIRDALESEYPVHTRLVPTRRIFEGARSVVAVALRAKGETLGVMAVGCRRERQYTQHDVAFIALVADHVAVALSHAQLHLREARTDHLTGLANRPEFERAVQREVAAARRYRRPFSVLLFDLDNLKQINDSHGHQAGDEAIQAVGEALKHVLRASDTCARFGGDEFGAAVPDADSSDAEEIASRIRVQLERINEARGLPEPIAVSIGFATLASGMDWRRLLKAADEVLYEDKRRRQVRSVQG